jgi:lipopolysaccharide export system ATP-binding protein
MALLTADGLSKRYRHRSVVKGVSLQVATGEVVGLLGPNGAGKTTCFYMIAGLIPVEGGRIALDGRDLTTLPMHARARLGMSYLAQEASVFRRLSVRDNVMAILETRKGLERPAREEACERLLADFGLTRLGDSLAVSLSGGERRRLEIARALAVEPRFILLDEPFAGVDPISVVEIQRIVQGLCGRGIGILITDHNVRETLGICNRAYIINEGSLIAEGAPDQVLADEHVRAVYLGRHFRL